MTFRRHAVLDGKVHTGRFLVSSAFHLVVNVKIEFCTQSCWQPRHLFAFQTRLAGWPLSTLEAVIPGTGRIFRDEDKKLYVVLIDRDDGTPRRYIKGGPWAAWKRNADCPVAR